MKIGILTTGGDCPGLNAVIRAIGLYALNNMENVEIVGIPEGYGGLIRGECRPLRRQDFSDILDRGGTILGTSRQPYKLMTVEENGETRLQEMCSNYQKMGLDCLFTLGGAGTHKTAALLCAEGCNVIGLPKTIDNDIYGTDVTFGFQTAAEAAAESVDRLRPAAAGHGGSMRVYANSWTGSRTEKGCPSGSCPTISSRWRRALFSIRRRLIKRKTAHLRASNGAKAR